MHRIVVATRNRHKIREISALLDGLAFASSVADLPDVPEVVEDAGTFVGNATKKAMEIARWFFGAGEGALRTLCADGAPGRVFILADDSGLEVDAIGGAPGVHSARFAALDTGAPGNSPDEANNEKLLRLMAHIPMARRSARFRCVMALVPVPCIKPNTVPDLPAVAGPGMEALVFEGSCEGRILAGASGKGGFGYDPLFVPEGFEESFAELGDSIKNQISHRSRAMAKVREVLAGWRD